ncbi:hypothetical protein PSEWESI4_04783 [Pseudomonas carbonaria]|uniref:Type VI secretion system secreted protein VgrG n=1 Tax=Zestomonas carbonaria TaxID=2762745 RepID=A0A7U7ESV3_9GAMM|nr:hypothetical protein PSEWESI4_04783 [Pseudomonas carbonaria]
MQGGNIELGMPGDFTVKAGSHSFVGPASLDHPLPAFLPPEDICVECLKMAAQSGSPLARKRS